MRTVNLHFDQDDLDRSAVYLATKGAVAVQRMFHDVIGYLSLWNLSYPVVDIYLHSYDGEFQACYRHKPFEQGEKPAYVIGAVFSSNTQKYGFHS